MRKVIAKKTVKPRRPVVPVTPPKTLTLRLNSDQAARLEAIMVARGRKTASGMIEEMIGDWKHLQDRLLEARQESARWQDAYIALHSDTEGLRDSLKLLLERLSQKDMFTPGA